MRRVIEMGIAQSELKEALQEALGNLFGNNYEEKAGLISQLDFIGVQLERIAKAMEKRK
jgi:hypothetical protein